MPPLLPVHHRARHLVRAGLAIAAMTWLSAPRLEAQNDKTLAKLLFGRWSVACYANSYDQGDPDAGAPEPGTRLFFPMTSVDLPGKPPLGIKNFNNWKAFQRTKIPIRLFPDVEDLYESQKAGTGPDMLRCEPGGGGCGVRLFFQDNKMFTRVFRFPQGAVRKWYHKTDYTLRPAGNDWMQAGIAQVYPLDDAVADAGDKGMYLWADPKHILAFTHNELVAWFSRKDYIDSLGNVVGVGLRMNGEWRKITYKSHHFNVADTTRGEIILTGPVFKKNKYTTSLLNYLGATEGMGTIPSFIPYYRTVSKYPAIEGGIAEGKDHPLLIQARNQDGGDLLRNACRNGGVAVTAGIPVSCDSVPTAPGDTINAIPPQKDSTLLKFSVSDTATGGAKIMDASPPLRWAYKSAFVNGVAMADSASVDQATEDSLSKLAARSPPYVNPNAGSGVIGAIQDANMTGWCAANGIPADECWDAVTKSDSIAVLYNTSWTASLDSIATMCRTPGGSARVGDCQAAATEQATIVCTNDPSARPDCADLLARWEIDAPPGANTPTQTAPDSLDLPLSDTLALRAPTPPKFPSYTPGKCFGAAITDTLALQPWLKKLSEHDLRRQQPDAQPLDVIGKPGDLSNRLTAALDPAALPPDQRANLEAWWLRNCPGKAVPSTWNLKGVQCDMTVLVPPKNLYGAPGPRAGAVPPTTPPPPDDGDSTASTAAPTDTEAPARLDARR